MILHDEDEPAWYGLHEVYYNDDGKITGITQNPVTFVATKELEGEAGIIRSVALAYKDVIAHEALVLSKITFEKQKMSLWDRILTFIGVYPKKLEEL